MIKNYLTLMVMFFGAQHVYSQQDSINIFKIDYERTLTIDDNSNPNISNYEFTKFIEFGKAIFKKTSKDLNSGNLVVDENEDTNFTYTPSEKDVSIVFKDYEKRECYFKGDIAFKYFVIKDSLDIFNWNILENKKEILGFKCQFATMSFRGRQYEAWFAPELPVGGPWKFDGLPGMILEIKSVDNFIEFKPIGIKNSTLKLDTIENSFDNKKALSWNEYKTLYKKKAIELLSYRPTGNSGGIVISKGGIEILIDKNDEEYNNAIKKWSDNN